MPTPVTAAVAYHPNQPFSLKTCQLDGPAPGEVLVTVEATGLCHTDIAARDQDMPLPLPAVLGHEGVGRIEALGEGVTGFQVGDRVLLGFGACGQCGNCQDQAPGYCDVGAVFLLQGSRLDGSSPMTCDGEAITGHFFGQSSFATKTVAIATNLVKVPEDMPAELLAPMACGVQTGMGSVMLSMAAKPGKAIAVLGCGTVGLSAIIAAKIIGCDPIIAVDRMPSRLELAKELGATHCLSGDDLLQNLAQLGGLDYALDTTGVPAVAEAAIDVLKPRGVMVCVGVGKPGACLNIDMGMLMATGRQVRGAIEGDAVPADFVPKMIDFYKQGQLPLEKLVTTYPFEQINQAVDDAHSGAAVKPVLLMR